MTTSGDLLKSSSFMVNKLTYSCSDYANCVIYMYQYHTVITTVMQTKTKIMKLCTNALCFLVSFPAEPDVTLTVNPPIPVEGGDATLTCSFTSYSLPPDYTPTVHYRWWRDDTETGQDDRELVISPVTSQHNGAVYRCRGWEENATFTEDSSVVLDVTCKCRLVSWMIKRHYNHKSTYFIT